ncbi:hypothetical protein ASPCADRAFT_206742 [Aspergillus carbonarius ITEM 5010]|uniref:Uncharacterized protein n=1 Tax=Aspergillus carbonarius (strain ITEM 5010) TaxID=602072 RepID=A0A1R3RQ35_ASPC5|nr:hypothetical protein ASPCADRAFT_206742 [Aspergillus carbonarius ITEM 5010]
MGCSEFPVSAPKRILCRGSVNEVAGMQRPPPSNHGEPARQDVNLTFHLGQPPERANFV